MDLRVTERIKSLVDERPALGDNHQTETETDVASTLYSCTDCEITYISTEMDTCPSCQSTVEKVPSESELGLDGAEQEL